VHLSKLSFAKENCYVEMTTLSLEVLFCLIEDVTTQSRD
jgi:hypothetical protein